jgi:hypothetical protein
MLRYRIQFDVLDEHGNTVQRDVALYFKLAKTRIDDFDDALHFNVKKHCHHEYDMPVRTTVKDVAFLGDV